MLLVDHAASDALGVWVVKRSDEDGNGSCKSKGNMQWAVEVAVI